MLERLSMETYQLMRCHMFVPLQDDILLWYSEFPAPYKCVSPLSPSPQTTPLFISAPCSADKNLPILASYWDCPAGPTNNLYVCLWFASSPTDLPVGELAKLTGSFQAYTWDTGNPSGVFSGGGTIGNVNIDSGNGRWAKFIFSSGGNEYHNNIAPCVASFCWRRTA